jgi:hypothetical protein
MKTEFGFLKTGFFGALLALSMIAALSIVIQIFGVDSLELQEKYFAGYQPLPVNELIGYLGVFKASLIADIFLISGQILAWLGLSTLLVKKHGKLALVIVITGLFGPVFDMIQNSMEWALVRALELNIQVPSSWFFSWTLVTQISFLFTFSSAFICGILLYAKTLVSRLFSFTAVLFVIAAAIGLYIAGTGILVFIWYFLWFLFSALLLRADSRKEN